VGNDCSGCGGPILENSRVIMSVATCGPDAISANAPHTITAANDMVDAINERRLEPTGYRVTEVILGERVSVGDEILPADAIAGQLSPGAAWQSAGLDEFKAFLDLVNAHSAMLIRLDEAGEQVITNRINDELAKAHRNLEELVAAGDAGDARLRSESTVV